MSRYALRQTRLGTWQVFDADDATYTGPSELCSWRDSLNAAKPVIDKRFCIAERSATVGNAACPIELERGFFEPAENRGGRWCVCTTAKDGTLHILSTKAADERATVLADVLHINFYHDKRPNNESVKS